MWASVRCLFKRSTLHSWLHYKGRACRMTSSLLRDRLDWTMGTVDLRPHTHTLFTWFPDDLWVLSNHFSWNTSFFPPQNYRIPSLGIALSEWIKKHITGFQKVDPAEMGHLFICVPGTWFCQLYAVYKKPLLSAFPVLWGTHTNNFKWGKCCWEYCFIWEF